MFQEKEENFSDKLINKQKNTVNRSNFEQLILQFILTLNDLIKSHVV